MSYHGTLSFIRGYLGACACPAFIEVGVDRGVAFFSLVQSLTAQQKPLVAVGIDVVLHEHVDLSIKLLDTRPDQHVVFYKGNSLDVLPAFLADNAGRFDLVMIDGDHNYYTVSRELELAEKLVCPTGLILVDDYHGRWSESEELWYSELSTHADSAATKKIETDKIGVKAAVDDFLKTRSNWKLDKISTGEPVLLHQHTVRVTNKESASVV